MNEELDKKARELMAFREQPLTSANYIAALRDVDSSERPRVEHHNEHLVAAAKQSRPSNYAELKESLLEASRRQAEPTVKQPTELQRQRARLLQEDGVRRFGVRLSEDQCLHVLSFG